MDSYKKIPPIQHLRLKLDDRNAFEPSKEDLEKHFQALKQHLIFVGAGDDNIKNFQDNIHYLINLNNHLASNPIYFETCCNFFGDLLSQLLNCVKNKAKLIDLLPLIYFCLNSKTINETPILGSFMLNCFYSIDENDIQEIDEKLWYFLSFFHCFYPLMDNQFYQHLSNIFHASSSIENSTILFFSNIFDYQSSQKLELHNAFFELFQNFISTVDLTQIDKFDNLYALLEKIFQRANNEINENKTDDNYQTYQDLLNNIYLKRIFDLVLGANFKNIKLIKYIPYEFILVYISKEKLLSIINSIILVQPNSDDNSNFFKEIRIFLKIMVKIIGYHQEIFEDNATFEATFNFLKYLGNIFQQVNFNTKRQIGIFFVNFNEKIICNNNFYTSPIFLESIEFYAQLVSMIYETDDSDLIYIVTCSILCLCKKLEKIDFITYKNFCQIFNQYILNQLMDFREIGHFNEVDDYKTFTDVIEYLQS